jgi:outer membrane protein assembly factor BamB
VDDVLYVSNRFQVAAYDLNDGQRKWQSPPPAGRMMRSQEWTLTPMPPLITHRYIFVRQLYGNGPVLVCLDKQSGQIVWTADQRSSEYVVSDPLLVQDQLMVLTLFRTDQQQGILRLAVFDADTGEVLRQHDVARLRDAWWSRKYCRATALDDSIVAALGGVVVCCDTSGGLRWVRKQVVLPVEEESRWVTQYFDRPWLRDRRLYVAQPGVRVVECLDPDTGNRHWNTLVLGVQRLIGFVDESLIVQTDDGLTALDLKTGSVKWTHAAADMLEGHLCGGDGGIMYSRREPDDNNANRFRPRLVWLDSQTGRATGSSPLTTLDDEDPRLGPLVPHKDRLWTFFGRGQNDANRDLLELIPQGEADEPPTTATSPDLWTRHVPAVLREAATKVLPDWQLLDGQTGPNTGLRSDVHGEKDALGIVGRLTAPATLAREITISPGTKPKLRIRVTDKAKQQCKLIVRFAGSTVFERKLNSPEPAGAWQQCEVDLSKIAGQRGWLVVEAFEAEGGESTTIYWRTLEVVY